jgi:predicted thioesterase
VPVLGTPRVVALAEAACVDALAGPLAEGQTSVGMKVQIDHLAPTAVGSHVDADATLESIEGRRLTFTVRVTDSRSLIAAGRIVRVIVTTESFLSKL